MAQNPTDHERSAAGLDFDFPIRERAASLGQALAQDGPEAFFEELENLIPEPVRDQITRFPLLAVVAGVGLGVWLGMRKGDEIIAAGTSLVTAAAMSSVSSAMDRD
ncbi:MAG TPA: hypothetical protein VJ276_05110 [Thermoanaerobaculia bacterium]|nr:hypothetical protein [Thermoanaerobaculia bacterium]